jgi:hypothetical protein
MKRCARPLLQVPWLLLGGFLLLLLMQIAFHQSAITQKAISYRPLSIPFDASIYRGLAMGSEQLFGYLLAIRLQLHDNQAGRHIRYSRIDYDLLVRWLDQIQALNPASEYPIMLASRVYSQTRDKARLRIILDYIDRIFMANPQLHWRHLAEATVIAKHRLGDLALALQMAQKLSSQPASVIMPAWARDIHLILLGDLNEYETAIAIISGLLKSDAVSDPDEKLFLQEKLLYFQQNLSEL